jgi:hypothetical protein
MLSEHQAAAKDLRQAAPVRRPILWPRVKANRLTTELDTLPVASAQAVPIPRKVFERCCTHNSTEPVEQLLGTPRRGCTIYRRVALY